jgi:hypothetical protein
LNQPISPTGIPKNSTISIQTELGQLESSPILNKDKEID